MGKIYYYKTIDDVFVFEDGTRKQGPEASEYLHALRRKGNEVERLYPNVPEHWPVIVRRFYTPDYWSGRTWRDAYFDR